MSKEEQEKAKLEAKKEAMKKAKKGFFSQFTINIANPSKYSHSLRNFMRDWLGIESNETNNIILKQILGTLERIEKIKNEEEIDGVDLGFINPEDIVDRNERVENYHQRMQAAASGAVGPATGGPASQSGAYLRKKGANQSFVSNNYYGQDEKIYVKQRNELINPAWIEVHYLDDCEIDYLEPKETEFFQKMIDRY